MLLLKSEYMKAVFSLLTLMVVFIVACSATSTTPAPSNEDTQPAATSAPSNEDTQPVTAPTPSNEDTLPELAPDGYRSISAGAYQTCGVRADDTVECWSPETANFEALGDLGDLEGFLSLFELEPSNPPAGEFTAVSTGAFHSCGIRANDTVECWIAETISTEENLNFEILNPPSGEFKSVSAGGLYSCGIRADDTVDCWVAVSDASNESGLTLELLSAGITPPSGEFKSVSVGFFHACGIRTADRAECWGFGNFLLGRKEFDPSGEFTTVSAGTFHNCGIRADGTVECWGSGVTDSIGSEEGYYLELLNSPSGEFKAISAGGVHNCGIRTDDTIECWGDNEVISQFDDPPSGKFSAVSVGVVHNCATGLDGTVECWNLSAPDVSGDPTSP